MKNHRATRRWASPRETSSRRLFPRRVSSSRDASVTRLPPEGGNQRVPTPPHLGYHRRSRPANGNDDLARPRRERSLSLDNTRSARRARWRAVVRERTDNFHARAPADSRWSGEMAAWGASVHAIHDARSVVSASRLRFDSFFFFFLSLSLSSIRRNFSVCVHSRHGGTSER